jgi:hypothetical protein
MQYVQYTDFHPSTSIYLTMVPLKSVEQRPSQEANSRATSKEVLRI